MKLSLAGWSLHKLVFAKIDPLKNVDLPKFVADQFKIDAIELNSPFFASREPAYLDQLVEAASRKVKMLNIAVDEKGDLSSDDDTERKQSISNYLAWIPIAKHIGCSAIRANSGGKNITDRAKSVERCTDSFRKLADEGNKHGITILMENHWGLSGEPDSIVAVMDAVRKTNGKDSIGTLPDFGNWPKDVDRYGSLQKIMPYAKAVHAKVMDIDEKLNHPAFDLAKCVKIAHDSGYDGHLGIEFEGSGDSIESIRRAIKKLQPMI